ncbi:hypothetical protein [Deinococcus sp.]|uniref:hypothetical protein n=1 Tax=Deinococcus sp. TaxID=47478 RepID=UPI0025C2CF21|nr:hypothetical protein [Deinococcus sp.]
MTRREYLLRCAWISLQRRWGWVAVAAVLAAAVAATLSVSLPLTLLITLLAPIATASGILINSVRRHSQDVLPVVGGDSAP